MVLINYNHKVIKKYQKGGEIAKILFLVLLGTK